MDYLYKNLDRSKSLPYDVMNIIYEYADPMVHIRKEIEKSHNLLDNIMYEKMKKYIQNRYIEYDRYDYNINETYIITPQEINDIELKHILLDAYKQKYFWRLRLINKICGLNTFYKCSYRGQMIEDLSLVEHIKLSLNPANIKNFINHRNYSTKEIYKNWIKL